MEELLIEQSERVILNLTEAISVILIIYITLLLHAVDRESSDIEPQASLITVHR